MPQKGRKLTTKEARKMAAKRKTFGAGPGRPRSRKMRCPCGAMTLKRAFNMRHKCEAPVAAAPEGE